MTDDVEEFEEEVARLAALGDREALVRVARARVGWIVCADISTFAADPVRSHRHRALFACQARRSANGWRKLLASEGYDVRGGS